ncbi:D-methionine transport system ATP-binding protein [Pilibacter termitis]|uniref:D-methionine transport system ATP-binding protein n=1 Tax=Pilibacter termitis TaxID=263852 RepID=A0A1T4LLD8_9ENTE|nr:methionine ABC transporter ATP-binding protein [Pilibacter termitis]SJZ55543.1 D-methionine transport system ATP-binding protein [Pilibacter termitis]
MSFIELKGITKHFQTKNGLVKAIDGVDVAIEKGDIFGIVGYSGAGKSTLVRLLNGLEVASSGEVLIDGEDVSKLTGAKLREFRKKVGMIFQHFNLLWSRTVLQNIELPLELAKVPKAQRKKRAEELLRLVGLEGRGDAYPNELSGGQKQRVGIARALANNPEILLSDESTSALDPQTTDEVLDLLLQINRKLGLTIVLITHEMHVIRKIANKVVVMEQGKIIESGNVLEVFQNPQNEVTKKFVTQELDPEFKETEQFLAEIHQENPQGIIVDLLFEEGANEPVITKVVRKFDVEISVLSGHLKQTKVGGIGTLTVLFTGEKEEIQLALDYIKEVGVKAEVRNIG